MLEDMQFHGNLVCDARQREFKAVLHGNDFVIGAMNQKTRRRLRGHLLFIAEQIDQLGIRGMLPSRFLREPA